MRRLAGCELTARNESASCVRPFDPVGDGMIMIALSGLYVGIHQGENAAPYGRGKLRPSFNHLVQFLVHGTVQGATCRCASRECAAFCAA